LRGSGVVAGQISAFPIDFAGRPYNTLTLPCERVIMLFYHPIRNQEIIKANLYRHYSHEICLLLRPQIPRHYIFLSRKETIVLCSRLSERTIPNVGAKFSLLHAASTAKHVGL